MINHFDHTALVVRDLDQTIDFYTRVLGFHVTRRLEFPGRVLVMLALGDGLGAKLELLRYDATDPADSVPMERSRLGLRHLAFHVSDVRAAFDRLAEAGVVMQDDPPFRQAGGPPIAFGYDPNGVLLEFTEIG